MAAAEREEARRAVAAKLVGVTEGAGGAEVGMEESEAAAWREEAKRVVAAMVGAAMVEAATGEAAGAARTER